LGRTFGIVGTLRKETVPRSSVDIIENVCHAITCEREIRCEEIENIELIGSSVVVVVVVVTA
jgi:hypothetical protein